MNLISFSINRPVAIVAVVLMVVLFGYVALQRIPIQMAPDVRQPVIIVQTFWPGSAPAEVEREIVNRQEEVLKGLEGIRSMQSRSRTGRAEVTLEFAPSQNMDKALLLVANRLDRVTGDPAEANEPLLRTSGTDDNAIAWFLLTRKPGNDRDMITYGDFLEDVVQERIERIEGISAVNIYGETKRELRIVVDAQRLAQYRLTVSDVLKRVRAENASISGGNVEEGKRSYVVRTEGDLNRPDQVRNIVLRSEYISGKERIGRVTVGDVAQVYLSYKKARAIAHNFDERAMAFNMTRSQGANVLETMSKVHVAVKELGEGVLNDVGLKVRNVYDETVYINSAIRLVQQNIFVGGVLAAVVLLLFLRSWRPTLVISLAIPVSVIGSFVAMALLGRSLNVISLAGIAFAVGMVVDAAIVVLENIFRLRQGGLSRSEAAYQGAIEVWPAVLVSALTTVMVFIPIFLMDLEVGQLFRDIAVAISVSVLLSLIVSISLIPALSNRLLVKSYSESESLRIPVLDHFASGFTRFWIFFTRLVVKSKISAIGVVVLITGLSIASTILFLPKLDYLPTGNRNFVFGFVQPPAGYNLDTVSKLTENIANRTRENWATEVKETDVKDDSPTFQRFIRVDFNGRAFIGGTAQDSTRVRDLIPIMQKAAFQEPGTFAFVFQPSLFGRSVGGGRAVDIDVSGPELPLIYEVGKRAFFKLMQLLPPKDGHRTRPLPSLTLGAPEIRVEPDPIALADNGLTAQELGQSIDAFNDGLRVSEITVDGKRIDLTLMGELDQINATQEIGSLPMVTREGRLIPVDSLAKVTVTSGPTEIRRSERVRTMTLRVTPSDSMPLQKAIELIRGQVIKPIEVAGMPEGVRFRVSGTADKLTETWNEIVIDLLLAVVIVYLVMAILFESFVYPLIILLSVPIAAAGGLAGLALLNKSVFQPLDMLTMLGFVILIGIVVNNAILLVHQTLLHIRKQGMSADEAITLATRNRIRPIFMSTLTSVFGMLPLVVFPGAGSELYRGLGSVVVGGLALSAVLTLAVVPPMMSISVAVWEKKSKWS